MTKSLFSVLVFAAAIGLAQVRQVDPPAGAGSGMAYLVKDAKGAVHLSWIQPEGQDGAGGHRLQFASWTGKGWGRAETIAAGKDWFVNWADFPSLSVRADGTMLAHWLTRSGEGGKWGYGIRVAQRDVKTGKWQERVGLNTENKNDYAGFLQFVSDGAMAGAVYLSPPAGGAGTAHAGGDEHEHRKTVRFVKFRSDGSKATDEELDADVCSCCQTTVTTTPKGLLAAYRDHLDGEIRDIAVVRQVGGKWTAPRRLHADGWKINGCPTEGPSAAASKQSVGIAWLTRANEQPKVQLSLSSDGGATFGDPLRIDDGNPLGRPMLTLLDAENYLVAWLEKTTAGKAEVRLRRVGLNGKSYGSFTVAGVAAARTAGFPKVMVSGDQVLVAWRDTQVRTSLLSKQELLSRKER